jgi:hypothetical protein
MDNTKKTILKNLTKVDKWSANYYFFIFTE